MSNSYNPFDLLPPKDVIQNAVKQMKTNAYQLLEDIRVLRNNPLADWLVEEKEKLHQQLIHRIHRYQMYLDGVDVSKDWEAAKDRAKQHPIKDMYVGQLRRSAGRLMGKCPFHTDDSPSFVIYANNTFHCFGCNANGDAIDFVMKRDNLDFKQAVKLIGG